MNTIKIEPGSQHPVKTEDFSSWEAILKIGGWHAPQQHGIGGMNRGPNLIDRRDYLNKDSQLPAIPNLEEISIPADMPERLKKDVWRCLKTLKREYEDQSKEEAMAPPEDYARLGNWDQKKKQDRRRMQNRKAARRFRVKNLEVVWAMVTSYQKSKAENDQLRQQVKLLGGQVPQTGAPSMPRLSMPALPPTVPGFVKQEPRLSPPQSAPCSVTPTEIIKIPPPLPPIAQGTPASKKRKLETGQAVPAQDAAWIVQRNAVDLIEQELLTLTVVCGKQDLKSVSDRDLVQKLSDQATEPEFAIQDASLSESATPVRAPKLWIDAIMQISKGN